jgi:hypothetical protein
MARGFQAASDGCVTPSIATTTPCSAVGSSKNSLTYFLQAIRRQGTTGRRSHLPVHEHLMDRGWSMNLNFAFLGLLFSLMIAGVAQANNQQAQQSWVNAAICLLAVRSGLSPERRSDLQVPYTSLALGDRCRSVESSAISQAVR